MRTHRHLMHLAALAVAGIGTHTALAAQQTTNRQPATSPALQGSAAAAGVPRRLLSSDTAIGLLGTPSPDGHLFSAVDWSTGDLAVRDMSSGALRRLTNKGSWQKSNDFALFSAFSPDGKQVAFTWYSIDLSTLAQTGQATVQLQLRVTGIDSAPGPGRVLFGVPGERAYVQPTDWTGDGLYIVTTGTAEDGTGRITLVPAAGGPARIIKSFPDWRSAASAKLSPSGDYLAYDYPPSKTDGRREIYVLPLAGGHETAVVRDAADAELVGWSADGTHVYFASERGGTPGLWTVPVENGKPRGDPALVKKDLWRSQPVFLTRDGHYYYGVLSGSQDVYVATYDAMGKLRSQPIAITGHPGEQLAYGGPSWSPDGKYVAYITQRVGAAAVGGNTISIYSLDSGERRLLRPPVAYLEALTWMPDGRSLALRAHDDKGRDALLRFDLKTGDISTLLVEPGRPMPAFSPDGRWLYYAPRPDAKNPRPRRVARNLTTGEERELYVGPAGGNEGGLRRMAVSRDGQWIATLAPTPLNGPTQFVLMPAMGGAARTTELRTESDSARPSLSGFSGDGRHLIYATRANAIGDDFNALWRIPVEGGQSERWDPPMKLFRAPRISPDGRHLAFFAGNLSGEIWVLDDLGPTFGRAQVGSSRK